MHADGVAIVIQVLVSLVSAMTEPAVVVVQVIVGAVDDSNSSEMQKYSWLMGKLTSYNCVHDK